jgi:hypothetical protein
MIDKKKEQLIDSGKGRDKEIIIPRPINIQSTSLIDAKKILEQEQTDDILKVEELPKLETDGADKDKENSDSSNSANTKKIINL